MTPEMLLATVADHFDLTSADLTGPARTRQVSEARQAAAWVLRKAIASISLESIGQLLGGRDHTTIIHSLAQIERRMQHDPALRAQLHSLLPQRTLPARARLDHAMRWWVAQARDCFFVRAA